MTLTLRITLSAILLIVCLVTAVAQDNLASGKSFKKNDNISAKYNKDKNETLVNLKPIALTGIREEKQQLYSMPLHQTDLSVFFTYAGQEVKKPVEKVTLSFRIVSRNYFVMRGQAVMAVLDRNTDKGRAIQLGDSDYKSKLEFNSVFQEFLTVTIPREALERIVNAQQVEFYVGPLGYQIKSKDVENLRDLAARMKP